MKAILESRGQPVWQFFKAVFPLCCRRVSKIPSVSSPQSPLLRPLLDYNSPTLTTPYCPIPLFSLSTRPSMGCSQSHLDPHGVAEESRKKAGLGPWSGDDVKAGRKADDGEERPGSPSFRFYFEGPWIDKDSAKVADAGEDHGIVFSVSLTALFG